MQNFRQVTRSHPSWIQRRRRKAHGHQTPRPHPTHHKTDVGQKTVNRHNGSRQGWPQRTTTITTSQMSS
eukprot:3749740-Prorocentrum_lima.AAC.1